MHGSNNHKATNWWSIIWNLFFINNYLYSIEFNIHLVGSRSSVGRACDFRQVVGGSRPTAVTIPGACRLIGATPKIGARLQRLKN